TTRCVSFESSYPSHRIKVERLSRKAPRRLPGSEHDERAKRAIPHGSLFIVGPALPVLQQVADLCQLVELSRNCSVLRLHLHLNLPARLVQGVAELQVPVVDLVVGLTVVPHRFA